MTRLQRLKREASKRSIILPSPVTVAKYGWALEDWLGMLEAQGWACGVCRMETQTGKYVTDHEHVKGWAQMPDAERRLYVRGLTCWFCNRYLLARGISVERALSVANYLETYAERRP